MTKLDSLRKPVVILANGEFPSHEIPLKKLQAAKTIICCDGAADGLIGFGIVPDVIIGDLDSISSKIKNDFSQIIKFEPDQNENDLRKSIKWVEKFGLNEITILGGSGKREDHFLGNIFSLIQFDSKMKLNFVTDYGVFEVLSDSKKFKANKMQQVSLFSLDPSIRITTEGLKYPLKNDQILNLYEGTLNEVIEKNFSINISHGKILVYIAF